MRRNASLRRACGFATATLVALSASAYDLIREGSALITWNPGPIPIVLRLSQATTFQDNTNHTTSVAAALDAWNAQFAHVQFTTDVQAPGSAGDFNALNEVTFEPRIYSAEPDAVDFGPNVLAVTISYRSGALRPDGTYARLESDVIFNTAASGGWDSYRGNLQSAQDIRRVAIHEFGHVLGLAHPDQDSQSVTAIMGSFVSNTDALQPDDINGAQFQYGRPGGFAAPANDNFANAATLTLNGTSIVLNAESIGATEEPDEPAHVPGAEGGASVWWKWTASAGGTLLVSTGGSLFDTFLAAYSGSALATLTHLASNDDVESGVLRRSEISFPVVFGETYYIAVDGWTGEWGEIKLSATVVDVVVPPLIVADPEDQTISVGESASMSVVASGDAPLTYRWQVSAEGSGAWTNLNDDALHSGTGTAELTFPAAADNARDGNAYRCVVTNTGGVAVTTLATLTVNRLAQTIDFAPLADRQYAPTPLTLTATADSELPVSFELVTGLATLDGDQLTLTGIGTVTLLATQAGNATYAAAPPVERTFVVTKGSATVTLGALEQVYDGEPHAVTVGTSPASFAVVVTYNGAASLPIAAGNYAVAAVVNDALYAGTAEGTLVIARAAQTITFDALADREFTTAPVALSATSSAELPVSFSVQSGLARIEGTSLLLEGSGIVVVRASQAGNDNYLAAPVVDRTFTVTGNFDSWLLERFTADELLDAEISGPNADPDRDGYANLVEYALGLDPRAASSAGLPAMSATETEWIFTYTRPAARDDVAYGVEFSTNLAQWSSNNATHERVATGATETWEARVARTAGANLFFRLRISR